MQDKYAAQRRYKEKTKAQLNIELNRKTDGDILAYLETVPNKAALIKALIRAQMAADGIAAAIAPTQEDNAELLPEWEED